MSTIYDDVEEVAAPPHEMVVQRGDLAAFSFHAKDIVNAKTGYLEKRRLAPGARVTLTIECEVVETPSGGLIFGNFKGNCQHG